MELYIRDFMKYQMKVYRNKIDLTLKFEGYFILIKSFVRNVHITSNY